MKQVKIISMNATDPSKATVEFTHDDGTVTTVSDLGPIPLHDSGAAYRWLARYEAADIAGRSSAGPSSPLTAGAVLTPRS